MDTAFPEQKYIPDEASTVSPFQIQEVIPSGGTGVSACTRRLTFHVMIQAEMITRRNTVQK